FGEQPEYYPKGMFCFRLVTVAPESHPPRWHDCDGGEGAYCTNYCGYTTAKSGEEGVGEYSYVGKRGCCGDDPNEYYIEGKDGTDACCKSPNRRVEGGVCVPTEQIITQKPAEQPTQESPEQDIPKPLTMLRGIMLWLELLGLISS
ncbi:hypothetical protein KY318_00915, partial [Candidatus Woesearchaeota archaeon]|nr:hypothetical protein [Candidatus Woesearchaeota archaeon]